MVNNGEIIEPSITETTPPLATSTETITPKSNIESKAVFVLSTINGSTNKPMTVSFDGKLMPVDSHTEYIK